MSKCLGFGLDVVPHAHHVRAVVQRIQEHRGQLQLTGVQQRWRVGHILESRRHHMDPSGLQRRPHHTQLCQAADELKRDRHIIP